ncbi:MAG: hypothetical protein IJL71_04005 [Oscillospiraceae bacterium]|nr:hypothetical protein [Oscillospiraceae bacterium]
MMRFFVYVKNLVGVKTNASSFRWSFGSASPETSNADYDACRIKAELDIVKDKNVAVPESLKNGKGNFRFFHGDRNRGTLYYYRRILGLIPLCYSLSVQGNTVRATVGKSYSRLVRLKVMNIHPIHYILFDLVTALMLKNGYLPVYAASFAWKDRGGLIMGPPNMGKTLTAIRLDEDPDIRLLGEDIAVTDGKRIYSVPWTDTYRRYYPKSDADKRPSFSGTPAELRYVFLLNRESGGKCRFGDCSKQISLLNRYGIKWSSSPAVIALSYFNDDLSLDSLLDRESEILRQVTENAAAAEVTSDDPLRFSVLIAEELKKDIIALRL